MRLGSRIIEIPRRRPAVVAALALTALYVGLVGIKLHHWPAQPFFTTDPAFRFRYVRMYAEGAGVPALDRAAQWPEGVAPARAFFLTQDAVIGVSFRLLRPLLPGDFTLTRYLVWQISLWGSLTLFVVYAWARRLFGSRPGALLACLVYMFSLAIYIRTCGNYLREDFVLPLYFFALYGQTRVIAGAGWRWALAAGAAFFLTLVSWHASSFLYFFAAVPLAAAAVSFREAKGVARAAAALAAAGVAAFAVHPALREKIFLTSPAFALALSAAAAAAFACWRPLGQWRRLGVLAAAFVAAYALGRLFAGGGEYSHIYVMILYKLRFFGVKPADPTTLPLAAREIWSGPANSPSLLSFAALLAAPVAVAAVPLVRHFRRLARGFADAACAFGGATLLFALLFGLLYAGYNRFSVVFVFFVATLAAGYSGIGGGRRRRWLWLLVPALLVPLEGVKALRYEDRPWPWTALLKAAAAAETGYATGVGDEQYRVVRWFGRQPDRRDAAVLAPFAASANFLTYAGTPIVLHPIFEAPGMRAKVRECWQALFADEDAFYRVCRKYNVTYVAYTAAFVSNYGPDSIRYAYAITKVPVTSCAYRMQFEPQTLRHFAPVFETVSWRIFLVGVPGAAAPDLGPPSPLFVGPAAAGGYYDEGHASRAYAVLDKALSFHNAGVEAYERRDFDRARADFRRALQLCPRLAGTWDALAWMELAAGNGRAAAAAASRALALDPYDDAARGALATLSRP